MALGLSPFQEKSERLINGGFSPEEVDEYAQTEQQRLVDGGFDDEEIDDYFGVQPFDDNRIINEAEQGRSSYPKPVTNFSEAMKAGWGMSIAGLTVNGELPEHQVDGDTDFLLSAAASIAQIAGDLPTFGAGIALAGGVGSAAAGPVVGAAIGLAGGFALTEGLRATYIDAMQNGPVNTANFADRFTSIMWETSKGWITGAATGAAGKVAKIALPGSTPTLIQKVAPTAAEVTAMVTVSKALEGELPTTNDFLHAAITIGGLKGATATAAKLRKIYKETGVKPEEVVDDAINDSTKWQDLLEPERTTVEAYKTQPRNQNITQAQRAEAALGSKQKDAKQGEETARQPAQTKEQQDRAQEFFDRPFARVPQAPGEPTLPGRINFNRVDTSKDAKAASARISEIYEKEITEAHGGRKSWERQEAEAGEVLAEVLGSTPEKVMAFMKGEKSSAKSTAELLARKQMVVAATEQLVTMRAELANKAEADITPREKAEFFAQAERTGIITATFLGERAEAGRMLNVLKQLTDATEQSKQIVEVMKSFGTGEQSFTKLLEKVGEVKEPAQAARAAREQIKATTGEKILEAWKSGLISGLQTFNVNIISTGIFTAMRIPEKAIASVYSKMTPGDKISFGEALALPLGMMAGVKRGAVDALDVAKTGKNLLSSSGTDGFRPAISGKLGEFVRLPFRALSTMDVFFRGMNHEGEIYSLAVRQALAEGKGYGSGEFTKRVGEIIKDPSPEMTKQSELIGKRFTFNEEAGPKSKAVKKFAKEWKAQWVFPFVRTIGNIFEETARRIPVTAPFVKNWNADFMAGGAKRAQALAEITVGSSIMAYVFSETMNGNITGGGPPDRKEKKALLEAGWRPYSIKFGDQYIGGYNRMGPAGTLAMMAADTATSWQYYTDNERDKMAKVLAIGFSRAVTNQSLMAGLSNLIAMVNDPGRYGDSFAENMARTAVPNLIGQFSAENDPLMREINTWQDSISSRIPGQREGLLPRRDSFGDPIKSHERMWFGSPFTVSTITDDPVRLAATQIGWAAPSIPKTLDVAPGVNFQGTDKIQLTPEQRDVFATRAGKMAYELLEPIVNDESWEDLSLLEKRREYEMAFQEARQITAEDLLLGVEESNPGIDLEEEAEDEFIREFEDRKTIKRPKI